MTKWLDIARKYEDQAEVAGKGSNPVILSWINAHGRPDATDDSTIAWCGFCMAGVFTEAGLGQVLPREPGAARSWRTVGVPLSGPRVGAVVVMPRPDPRNPNAAHVGLIAGFDATHIQVLAGNQGNRVSTATFARNDLGYIYRWPVNEATPAELAAQGSRIAAAAQRQKRDAVVSGTASGTTQLPAAAAPAAAPVSPAVSPPASAPAGRGLREAVDSALGDVTWLKTAFTQVLDFATFAGLHWRWVALAVAAYYGLRFVYDSHMIGLWRTQDHNQGRNVVAPAPTPEASP